MPASRLRCSSSEKVFAVIATIGMVAASGRCIARIVRVASSPSISGIITSIIGLFAGALFGGSGLVATSAYFIGVGAGIITSIRMQSNVPGSLSEKRRTASCPFHA